ncbi:hypothetical protein CAPTEDRAFT_146425 [Capitella teleta]|uniref:Chorion peroxidase n=1 Tax=Capitella teleta TaxID=283909 RepID=R7TEM1_CAPTE|nr:hypothetical protein CAPTEDRAFT_146425 [Capitella teleta]|eukprot:ELT89922.1 hypothetical protein CAPTEDRAFT_146425 [Capitella teleta]
MARSPPFLKANPHVVGADTLPPKPEVDTCPYASQVVCDASHIYRSYDGKCNNMQSPYWGSSHYPLARFLNPNYADAIDVPRKGPTGYSLPSPRLVSSTIHWDVDIPHHTHTLMLMQFGQFLDHDISRTAISKLNMDPNSGHGLENQECLPIEVPRNDSIYGRDPCLMFVRSQQAPNPNCKIGPREQLNQVTSHLDCSHIYGSSLKEANDLRDFSDRRGRLKTTPHPAGRRYKEMLPQDPQFKDCKGDNHTILCFKAGDGRVNEFMGLATHHLLWMREHNRVEESLHRMNPHWNGEKLYQETRRLVGAMWQNVIYAEFLPILLGPTIMERYGLYLKDRGYWNGYDQTVNPSCSNSFATAAMRFGHSLIQGMLNTRNVDYSFREAIPVSTMFRRPHMMYFPPQVGTDAIMRGFLTQNSQSMDSFISAEVTSHLFAEHPPKGFGEDLASLNMQRAREHGIPGYNFYREWCGLPKAYTWADLSNELPSRSSYYSQYSRHVDDIDLFPAGISEFAYPGSLLGPTFSCIIASQYRNFKYGDRFWFENAQHNPYPFTQAQMREIRKSSVAKVICNNADSITHLQPKVMLHPRSRVLKNLR